MKTFRTIDGTEWKVVVTVGTIKRVLDETGLKLTDLFATEAKIGEFFSDDIKFCEVLWSVVRPQADELGRTTDQFFGNIDGTVIEQAVEALLAEVVDFFQEPRRTLLRKVLTRYQESHRKLQTEGVLAVERLIETTDFEQAIRQTHTNSASSSPALAALIRGDTPSAN